MAIWKSFLVLPKEVPNAGILASGCKLVSLGAKGFGGQDEMKMWL